MKEIKQEITIDTETEADSTHDLHSEADFNLILPDNDAASESDDLDYDIDMVESVPGRPLQDMTMTGQQTLPTSSTWLDQPLLPQQQTKVILKGICMLIAYIHNFKSMYLGK